MIVKRTFAILWLGLASGAPAPAQNLPPPSVRLICDGTLTKEDTGQRARDLGLARQTVAAKGRVEIWAADGKAAMRWTDLEGSSGSFFILPGLWSVTNDAFTLNHAEGSRTRNGTISRTTGNIRTSQVDSTGSGQLSQTFEGMCASEGKPIF